MCVIKLSPILKVLSQVFGDEGIRLMCWPHANRRIKDNLKPVTSVKKALRQQNLEDIEAVQKGCYTEQF